jgi:hypothetical protein
MRSQLDAPLEGRDSHGATKFSGRHAVTSLERVVEIGNVPEACGIRDFRNGLAALSVQQIAGAELDSPVVDMLAHRPTRGREQLVHVTFRAMESQCEYRRRKVRVNDVPVDMIHHHRQQYWNVD